MLTPVDFGGVSEVDDTGQVSTGLACKRNSTDGIFDDYNIIPAQGLH